VLLDTPYRIPVAFIATRTFFLSGSAVYCQHFASSSYESLTHCQSLLPRRKLSYFTCDWNCEVLRKCGDNVIQQAKLCEQVRAVVSLTGDSL
jgi:hypothetical protein